MAIADIQGFSAGKLSAYLSDFSKYVHLLQDIVSNDRCDNSSTQRLLGFQSRGSGVGYIVPEESVLYRAAKRSNTSPGRIELVRSQLTQLIQEVIRKKVKSLINTESRQCYQSQFLEACRSIGDDRCRYLSRQDYIALFRIYIQQIRIMSILLLAPMDAQMQAQQM